MYMLTLETHDLAAWICNANEMYFGVPRCVFPIWNKLDGKGKDLSDQDLSAP